MELVRVVDGDLEKAGENIDKLNEEILGQIGEIRTLLESVNSAWKSPASTKYVNELIGSYVSDLNELSEGISEYSNFIKQVYPTYDEVESTYQSKINSIGV